MSNRRVLPGFGLTLGVTLLVIGVATLLPLTALVLKAAQLGPAEWWEIAASPRALASYRVTLTAAALATAANVVLGVLAAWILVRYEFPGRRLLDALIDLPFAVPTAVAGISLAALLGPHGPIGSRLEPLGFKIAYAWPGIVIAMTFTSFPFVVRTVQPVLAEVEGTLEEAGAILGAGPWARFRRVIWPEIRPAVWSGATLAFVRSLGEFGAIVFISGNLPFRTEITALLIFVRVGEYDYRGAAVIASVVLFAAFLVLLAANFQQRRLHRRLHATA